MCGPVILDFDLDISGISGLYGQLSWSVDQVFFGISSKLIVIGHEQGVKGACVYAETAKNTFAVVNLRHDALLVMFPLLIDLDHTNGFRNPLARDCT